MIIGYKTWHKLYLCQGPVLTMETKGEGPVRRCVVRFLYSDKSKEGSSTYGRDLGILANGDVCLRPQQLAAPVFPLCYTNDIFGPYIEVLTIWMILEKLTPFGIYYPDTAQWC